MGERKSKNGHGRPYTVGCGTGHPLSTIQWHQVDQDPASRSYESKCHEGPANEKGQEVLLRADSCPQMNTEPSKRVGNAEISIKGTFSGEAKTGLRA